jgi:hypothetical protein
MFTDRRTFLAWAGGAAVLATTPHALSAEVAPRLPSQDDFDFTWMRRVTGKYRAVLDAPEVEGGIPIVRAVVWGMQYAQAFGVPMSQISQVLVLRHHAIELAMGDAYWARFPLGTELKFSDASGQPYRKNPVRGERLELPEGFRPLTLEKFQANGGIVLACDLALAHYAVPRYQATGMSAMDARAAAIKDLLPGVILQPSGIFAVAAAQDVGCRYVPASAM